MRCPPRPRAGEGHGAGAGGGAGLGAGCPRASCPQELLDHVAWHAVEEEGHHDEEQEGQHDFDDEPLVAGTDEVFDGLERVEEPDERRVGAAAGERNACFHGCHGHGEGRQHG